MKNIFRITLTQILICVSCVLGGLPDSYAKITTTLLDENFHSWYFPPFGWYETGWRAYDFWYYSNHGKGGHNGSAMFSFAYDGHSDYLTSPRIDASGFTAEDDSIFVEFDLWWEFNAKNHHWGPDHFNVYADGWGEWATLAQLNTNDDYTFDNRWSYSHYHDPLTSSFYWRHYRLLIPRSHYNEHLQIIFHGWASPGGGNLGIDNVVVTGERVQRASYEPAMLDFGTQPRFTTSAQKCVTLTNESVCSIAINSATLTGPLASSYTIVGTVPSSIPPHSSVDICVQFEPLAVGMFPANLVIANTSDNNPEITIILNGEGVAPYIQLIPLGENLADQMFRNTRAIIDDTVVQGVIAKNIGRADLVISPATGIGGENWDSYWLTGLPEYPIPPGESDTIFFAFCPRREGVLPAFTSIESNAENGAQIVNFVGLGTLPRIVVTPQILDFDSVGIGEWKTEKFTIANPGSDTLRLLKLYFSSADPDFTMALLALGEMIVPPQHTRNVYITFGPVQSGIRVARLSMITNIPLTFEDEFEDGNGDEGAGYWQSSQSMKLVRRDTATILSLDIFGTGVPYGRLTSPDLRSEGALLDSSVIGVEKCTDITITNPGEYPVTIHSVSFSGVAASAYKLSGMNLPYQLDKKSSVTVQVCGTPPERGSNQVMLTIRGTSNERAIMLGGAVDIKGLIACANRTPEMAFTNTITVNNTSEIAYVTVSNCGDIAAAFTAAITGPDAGLYTLSPASVGPIAAGESMEVRVTFTPDSRGVKSALLTFTDVAGNIAPMTIALGGEGGCAIPNTSQATFTIEEAIGKTEPTQFKINITNTGNIPWDAGIPRVTPTDHFKYVDGPGVIPPGGSVDMTLSYHPKTLGTHIATVTFDDAGPCQENSLSIHLIGESVVSSVSDDRTADGFALEQNIPNPTNGMTAVRYTVPVACAVRITLVDMTGRTVGELVNEKVSKGIHEVAFSTSRLASGSYLYILDAGSVRLVKQLIVQR